MTGSWLVSWHEHPRERPVLLCLPGAGSGCGQFRPWQAVLGDAVCVVGVQLPGREARWGDPWPPSVAEAADAVAAELTGLLAADHPVVMFGHSFGALLGYEVTTRLERLDGRRPRALVVAACRPPDMWAGAGGRLFNDEAELRRLFADRHLDENDLDEDTRQLMLEVLRQDAKLTAGYTNPGGPPVACAVEVWSADRDDTACAEDLLGWRRYAAGGLRHRSFAGGHHIWIERPQHGLTILARLTGSCHDR